MPNMKPPAHILRTCPVIRVYKNSDKINSFPLRLYDGHGWLFREDLIAEKNLTFGTPELLNEVYSWVFYPELVATPPSQKQAYINAMQQSFKSLGDKWPKK